MDGCVTYAICALQLLLGKHRLGWPRAEQQELYNREAGENDAQEHASLSLTLKAGSVCAAY